MSYMHIDNLYKNQTILLLKQCYALEKVHGTSAHISFKHDNNTSSTNPYIINYFSGGCDYMSFRKLFDGDELMDKFKQLGYFKQLVYFKQLGHSNITVYGEAYGGKCQRMSETYGKQLQFIVFEVKIGDMWLNVGNAEDVATKLGLEFMPYVIIDTDMELIDAMRDSPSIVSVRRGIVGDKKREGIVLRPLIELTDNRGSRIIAKHKTDEYRETAKERKIGRELEVTDNEKTAIEWVTDMRLRHVLDAIGNPHDMADTPRVLSAMIEDIMREGAGEIIDSKETKLAISKATLVKWKKFIASNKIIEKVILE